MNSIIKVPLIVSVATILSLSKASVSLAFNCIYGGEFAKYSTRYQGVVRAKVKKYVEKTGDTKYKGMVVEVTDVINGKFNNSELKFIGETFYGSNFPLVDIDSRKFRVGQEFLFIIRDRERVQGLGGCGESFVLIEDDLVKGRRLLDTGYEAYSMPLNSLIEKMKVEEIEY